MSLLDCSEAEALDIIASDKKIDKGEKVEFDLSKEKQKQAQKYAHTGTKTVYKWTTRERKKDEEKRKIIAELANFCKKFDEKMEIRNAERGHRWRPPPRHLPAVFF